MSCNICGKATGPGALLCRPCKSALKRARQFTVFEMPGTPPAVTMTGLPLAAPRRPAPERRARRPRRRLRPWRRLALAGVAAVAVLGAAAYVAHPTDPARSALVAPRLGPAPRPAVMPDGVSNPERVSDFAPARGKDRPR
ncbi:MAG: hypothetical protein IT518_26875 [Burkholderiales bacterium]|nr:hypothetical protein [Burkholderiales bacterium]